MKRRDSEKWRNFAASRPIAGTALIIAPTSRGQKERFVPTIEANQVRVITEPAVYLVGVQTISDAELDRFLADHGVAWQSDTEVAGEYLAEAAGRVCYMSFAKPRPGGNQAYLKHILEVGHGSVLEHAVWNFVF